MTFILVWFSLKYKKPWICDLNSLYTLWPCRVCEVILVVHVLLWGGRRVCWKIVLVGFFSGCLSVICLMSWICVTDKWLFFCISYSNSSDRVGCWLISFFSLLLCFFLIFVCLSEWVFALFFFIFLCIF